MTPPPPIPIFVSSWSSHAVRTNRSWSCHRDSQRDNDTIPIRFLIAMLDYGGGRGGIMVPSSDACWPCPSIFMEIVSASVFLTRL